MLLRKQSSYSETFHAKLQFSPTQTGYEAGLVLWWSQYSFASIGISLVQLPGGRLTRTAVFRKPTGKAGILHESTPLTEGIAGGEVADVPETTELKIEARPTEYILSLGSDNLKEQFSVPATNLTVTPPIGGAFCGTMFGLYSFGKGEPVLDAADFSDIFMREGSGA
jgi:hypothetical protein